jgi:hypothetical protein
MATFCLDIAELIQPLPNAACIGAAYAERPSLPASSLRLWSSSTAADRSAGRPGGDRRVNLLHCYRVSDSVFGAILAQSAVFPGPHEVAECKVSRRPTKVQMAEEKRRRSRSHHDHWTKSRDPHLPYTAVSPLEIRRSIASGTAASSCSTFLNRVRDPFISSPTTKTS